MCYGNAGIGQGSPAMPRIKYNLSYKRRTCGLPVVVSFAVLGLAFPVRGLVMILRLLSLCGFRI